MERVGGYEILEPLSRGAQGAVYRARGRDGGEVALKRLHQEGGSERCEIEARLLSGLRHPRVVQVHGHLHEGGSDYLLMELVVGRDLGRVIAEQGAPGLPVELAIDYAGQACEALQYVHDQQIVHRDVKPQNLVLADHGLVLVDFGTAREVEPEESGGTRGVGTPLYMAPEVLVGEAVSPRSDVFGLAATVWALIAGRPPSYADATVLSDEFAGVTPALERTLRRGMELHPERRFGSAAALAAALGSPLDLTAGESFAASVTGPDGHRRLIEAIVRTAAGVFDAAAASLALVDPITSELVYQAAWGAGAAEIVGVRLDSGKGLAGATVTSGEPIVVPSCCDDPRFAAQLASGTGYVPNTMLIVPLSGEAGVLGALSILDRRDGGAYSEVDLPRAALFAELSATAIGG